MSDPFFRQFFGGGMPRELVQRSLGSGVIVDPSGLVVTNYHVIADASLRDHLRAQHSELLDTLGWRTIALADHPGEGRVVDTSGAYGKWLTDAQFRARFGLIPSATRPASAIDRIGAVSDRNGTMPGVTSP